MPDKRFIEETFPVKEVSIESAREKNIRHGHISTLHIWWARRPLASSRATAYAALIPAPKDTDEWNKTRNFIAEFSKWENSLNQTMIQKARADILKANGGKPPRVLDPFGGGGAIPLEALRLGCETYSNDLNPVAVLIQKCTLEYPQKYGKKSGNPGGAAARVLRESNAAYGKNNQQALFSVQEESAAYDANPLLADVKFWGSWVLEEAKKDIGRFYPPNDDGHIPVGYYWMRTIPCQNPTCGEDIPLTANFWLSKKDKKKVALYPYVENSPQPKSQNTTGFPLPSAGEGVGEGEKSTKIDFKIVGTGYEPMPAGFDPEKGSVARAVATCPVCGSMVAANTTRSLFQEGKAGERMVAVVVHKEIHRVLKPGGIAVIVYAHKSTEGWETLINSLLDSNLIMTGAWPLKTEMAGRLRAQESATLSSSIYIVARKMTRQPTGFYHQVREALKEHMDKKLERLWQEGIGGADFFIAAIGSAIEVFGKYEQVMDYEGNIVRAARMLEDVRKIATEYAVRQILHNGFAGEISDLTRFYVLYRWNYGSAKILFDEAQKLARSCGIDIAREWSGGGFIRKEKEFIRVLGPEDRESDDIKRREELIDVLHRTLLHWEKGKRTELIDLLKESGFGKGEAFYRVAQAISETLPNESKEKKLLDGFLAGRERLREEMKTVTQGELL